MWLASEMAAFAHVAELGSFTAAARALGVPKVAVSRAIASLERRLGSRLLTRTPRTPPCRPPPPRGCPPPRRAPGGPPPPRGFGRRRGAPPPPPSPPPPRP